MTPCDYFNDRPEKYLEIIICFMNSLCQYDLIILISLGFRVCGWMKGLIATTPMARIGEELLV